MDDEAVLRDLARAAREEAAAERERWDDRWDRLSAGELSAAEGAELEALAARSPEAAAAYEAFRPLGPEFQARVVGAIRAQGSATASPASPVADLPQSPAFEPFPSRADRAVPPAARQPRGRILRFPWLRFALPGAMAAAAAALFLAVRLPPALPAYVLDEPTGGSRPLRGAAGTAGDAGELVLRPGEPFAVVARPATEPGQGGLRRRPPLAARAFLATGGGALLPLEARAEIDPGGSVKLVGAIGGEAPPGPATLWTIVGYGGRLPAPAEIAALRGREGRTRHWIALPHPIEIRAP